MLPLVALCSVFAADPAPNVPVADVKQIEGIKAQILKLNAENAIAREEAERELLRIGMPALPLLKEASASKEPEIAARAKRLVGKLLEANAKPVQSYAEMFPANTIAFLEFSNLKDFLEKLKTSPVGQFINLPATQTFFKKHQKAQVDSDQKMLDALIGMRNLIDGKFLFAIGAGETADAGEIDPPMVYMLESKQAQALEAQVRAFFLGIADPPKSTRRYGPFTIDEHLIAQTVFGQDSVIHALTAPAVEAFLDNYLKRPAPPLTESLSALRALTPQPDITLHINTQDLAKLSEGTMLIDDELVKAVETFGAAPGTLFQSAMRVKPEGIEEQFRLAIKDSDKKNSLLALLKKMAAQMPPAPAADAPQALDLIPWQAGILISFQGDVSSNAADLSAALKAIDALSAPPARPVVMPKQPAPNNKAAPKNPAHKTEGNTPAGEALKDVLDTAPKKDKLTPEDAVLPAPVAVHPRIDALEKTGLTLAKLFEQVQGPAQLAIFPQKIEGEDMPDDLPFSPLLAFLLKDPAGIEQILEAGAAGPAPRYRKDVLNGGTHYIDTTGDAEARGGFWLKGSHLAYSTERALLDLAGNALLHGKGNERMADRASYKQAAATLTPDCLLTIFGEAEQVLETPYQMAKITWQEDMENPWPAFDQVKPLLQKKSVLVTFKSMPGGLLGYALTPLSLLGMVEAIRRPIVEGNF
jgi:hypothetical protein